MSGFHPEPGPGLASNGHPTSEPSAAGETPTDGGLYPQFPEPLRRHARFIDAALSTYGGTVAGQDVAEAWLAITEALSDRFALAEALEDVADPMRALRRSAESRGAQLSGAAYSIANNLGFVQSLARAALAASKALGPLDRTGGQNTPGITTKSKASQ